MHKLQFTLLTEIIEFASKIKVPAFVSSEASLPGLQRADFSLCSHMAFLCMEIEREEERERQRQRQERKISDVSSSSYDDTSPFRLRSHPYDLT